MRSVFGLDNGMHNDFTSVWNDGMVTFKLEKKDRFTVLTVIYGD